MNSGISLLTARLGESSSESENQFASYFDTLNNTTSTMEYLGIKVKTVFYKIVAVYTTLVYAAYAMMQGLDGIISDKKLNKAIDILIDPAKAVKADKTLKSLKKTFKNLKIGKNAKKFGTNAKKFGTKAKKGKNPFKKKKKK